MPQNDPAFVEHLSAAHDRPIMVALGSTNPSKRQAIIYGFRAAYKRAVYVTTFSVASGVPAQPIGDVATTRGAMTRAERAYATHLLTHGIAPDFAVGIEGGIESEASGMSSYSRVAILRAGSQRWGLARSGSFELPQRLAALVRNGYELGAAADFLFNTENIKAHGGTIEALTRGALRRANYDATTIILALVPFLHDDASLF